MPSPDRRSPAIAPATGARNLQLGPGWENGGWSLAQRGGRLQEVSLPGLPAIFGRSEWSEKCWRFSEGGDRPAKQTWQRNAGRRETDRCRAAFSGEPPLWTPDR